MSHPYPNATLRSAASLLAAAGASGLHIGELRTALAEGFFSSGEIYDRILGSEVGQLARQEAWRRSRARQDRHDRRYLRAVRRVADTLRKNKPVTVGVTEDETGQIYRWIDSPYGTVGVDSVVARLHDAPLSNSFMFPVPEVEGTAYLWDLIEAAN